MELYFILVVAISATLTTVNGLDCYSCNNGEEPKCGNTWELSEEEAAKYIVACEGDNVACKKIDTIDSNFGNHLVTRSCWQANEGVHVDDNVFKCTKIAEAGTACYCKENKDGKPCNGDLSLHQHTSFLVLMISIVGYFVARVL